MKKIILNIVCVVTALSCKNALADKGPIHLRYQLEDVATKMRIKSNAQVDCKKYADIAKKYFELKCDDTEKSDKICYDLSMNTYDLATERVSDYPSLQFNSKYTILLMNRSVPYKSQPNDLLSMNVRLPSSVSFVSNTVKTNISFRDENDLFRLAKNLDLDDFKKISETQFEISNRLLACAVENGGVLVSGRGVAEISTYHPEDRLHIQVLEKSYSKAFELEKSELSLAKKYYQLGSVVGESIRTLKPNLNPNDLEHLSSSALGILLQDSDSNFDVRQKNNTTGNVISDILNQKFYQENLKFHVEGLEL